MTCDKCKYFGTPANYIRYTGKACLNKKGCPYTGGYRESKKEVMK